jgi:magnesium and cobalt transporter
MSETTEQLSNSAEDSEAAEIPRKGLREWLSDLFSDEPANLSDIITVLKGAAERQLIDLDVLNIVVGALHVGEMHARDIMIPKSSLVVINEDQELKDLLPTIVESRHSRFPVIGESLDDIKGILHAKDLLPLMMDEEHQKFSMKDCIRSASVIPESKRLNDLLQEFRSTRNHMAVVVDEYGQVSGVVTIEDVLEQIVGDIEDEHDVDEDNLVTQIEPSIFHVKALMPIDDFNERFATQFSDEEFDTIGGIVLQAFGHMPQRGEELEIADISFEVLNADSRRVRLLRVKTTS